ncbi:retrovirus-related pol polyprotein from transposon TNT 1-94 [Tanacetum coccineum]
MKTQIIKIWSDNGTGFKNEKFRIFYETFGTIHHTFTARTAQQNGVVERRNHTLVEAARTTLLLLLALLIIALLYTHEYYVTRSLQVSDNSAANTLDKEDTPSSSSTIVEENEAPQIVTSSEELVANELTTLMMMNQFKKKLQKLMEILIGDPSKPVMTGRRIDTDAEMYMYALTVSTMEPKNVKQVMLDHSWIESMQDELKQFKHLDV